MTRINFVTPGLIDLNVIQVMGVSVKVNDNPIGYFGTGLKYALAILLRTGHTITMNRGGEFFEFHAVPTKIRGESFDIIHMNDKALPFTTDLGRNWDVWQAYRELHSNTLDEAGIITDFDLHPTIHKLRASSEYTAFYIEGHDIVKAYNNRDEIFLTSEPLSADSSIEVHAGATSYIYYRGVRAGTLSKMSQNTYNILEPMSLSEDRNLESEYAVRSKISQRLPKQDCIEVHESYITAKNTFESDLVLSRYEPAPAFLNLVKGHGANAIASARSVLKYTQGSEDVHEIFKPSQASESDLDTCLKLITKLGCDLKREDFTIVRNLGEDVFGFYKPPTKEIFIDSKTLDMGNDFLAATLYEEWLHKVYGFSDESRSMQNFLFQRLIKLAHHLKSSN